MVMTFCMSKSNMRPTFPMYSFQLLNLRHFLYTLSRQYSALHESHGVHESHGSVQTGFFLDMQKQRVKFTGQF